MAWEVRGEGMARKRGREKVVVKSGWQTEEGELWTIKIN